MYGYQLAGTAKKNPFNQLTGFTLKGQQFKKALWKM